MAYVNEIDASSAGPKLRELYRAIETQMGFLPHYFQALGAKPEMVEAQLTLNDAVMGDGALPNVVKEQIGIVVSGINSSSYCIAIHMELLRRFGVEKNLARKLAVDYQHTPVEEKTQALFRFADKLTRTPDDIEESDVDALRKAGWDDPAIRETVLAVAYFNFINRVSQGLGLIADF
jgi:uncharacterized peroxidase-related enzyme